MRIAVFRTVEDGRRTAARLADLGHEAVLASVIRIVPTGATVRAGDADGLVFTSAHAPWALASHPDGVAAIRHLSCWCVGTRTAEAARSAGFAHARAGEGTAAGLARAVLADHGVARLAFVTGPDRKPDLEAALALAGVRPTVVEAYRAQSVPFWSPDTVDALAGTAVALHYSRRSARLASRLAEAAGLGARFRSWTHCCLSADVAAGLPDSATRVLLARSPDESNLLALLEN